MQYANNGKPINLLPARLANALITRHGFNEVTLTYVWEGELKSVQFYQTTHGVFGERQNENAGEHWLTTSHLSEKDFLRNYLVYSRDGGQANYVTRYVITGSMGFGSEIPKQAINELDELVRSHFGEFVVVVL